MAILIGTNGNIKADGDFDLADFGLPTSNASGRLAIYAAGVYGGATITLGYMSRGAFFPHELPDGSGPAAYTDSFQVDAATGTNSALAINVAGFTGTTDIELKVTPVR